MSTYSQLPGQMSLAFRRGDDFSATIDFDISLSGYTVSSSVTSLVTGNHVSLRRCDRESLDLTD